MKLSINDYIILGFTTQYSLMYSFIISPERQKKHILFISVDTMTGGLSPESEIEYFLIKLRTTIADNYVYI